MTRWCRFLSILVWHTYVRPHSSKCFFILLVHPLRHFCVCLVEAFLPFGAPPRKTPTTQPLFSPSCRRRDRGGVAAAWWWLFPGKKVDERPTNLLLPLSFPPSLLPPIVSRNDFLPSLSSSARVSPPPLPPQPAFLIDKLYLLMSQFVAGKTLSF